MATNREGLRRALQRASEAIAQERRRIDQLEQENAELWHEVRQFGQMVRDLSKSAQKAQVSSVERLDRRINELDNTIRTGLQHLDARKSDKRNRKSS